MSDDDEPPIELQTLPLDAWHRAQGARMVPFAGYHMPVQYDGVMAEHLWTRQAAGLFDVSHMGQLSLTGAGAAAALEALLPGDIIGLGEGRMRYSLLMADGGGVLDDLMVTRMPAGGMFSTALEGAFSTSLEQNGGGGLGPNGGGGLGANGGGAPGWSGGVALEANVGGGAEAFYVVVNGATKYDDLAHIHEHLPDAVTLNHMDEQALLALQGPQAVDALARIAPGVERLVFMTAGAFSIAGVDAWISRSGYTGEDGFEISVAAEDALRVASALMAQPEVKPIGLGARDSLRLEAGLPLYGHDLDEATSPIMADLGFAVARRRREGGGFPGHARLVAEREDGPAAKRVGLMVDGRQPVREGARVLDGQGNEVGKVTSGGFSPTLQRPIAMAYLPPALAALHAEVMLEQRGKLFQATVAAMPFVPHRYVRKV